MSDFSLNSILDLAATAKSTIQVGYAGVEDLLAQAATLTGDTTALLTQSAKDASLLSTTKTAAELSVQSARQALGIDFGTDRNAQNQIYTGLAAIEKGEFQKQMTAKAAIPSDLLIREFPRMAA